MSNHTPGPWRVSPSNNGILTFVGPESHAVAGVYTHTRIVGSGGRAIDVEPTKYGLADAHLIAAAPEMYEALVLIARTANYKQEDTSIEMGERLVDIEKIAKQTIDIHAFVG